MRGRNRQRPGKLNLRPQPRHLENQLRRPAPRPASPALRATQPLSTLLLPRLPRLRYRSPRYLWYRYPLTLPSPSSPLPEHHPRGNDARLMLRERSRSSESVNWAQTVSSRSDEDIIHTSSNSTMAVVASSSTNGTCKTNTLIAFVFLLSFCILFRWYSLDNYLCQFVRLAGRDLASFDASPLTRQIPLRLSVKVCFRFTLFQSTINSLRYLAFMLKVCWHDELECRSDIYHFCKPSEVFSFNLPEKPVLYCTGLFCFFTGMTVFVLWSVVLACPTPKSCVASLYITSRSPTYANIVDSGLRWLDYEKACSTDTWPNIRYK